MKRTITTLMALFVVTALLAAPAAAAVAADDETDAETEDEFETDTEGSENDSDDVAPGERLAGVVGVQEAEFDGDIAERAFGLKVAKAASDEAKADVVGEQVADVESRLDDLEERADDLERARADGEISEGQYEAEMAEVAAEKETAKRLSNRSATTARELPADLLESKGIDADAIQALQDRADELGGEEVAEIARAIAGPDVGKEMSGGPFEAPTDGPGDDERTDNDTDRGEAPDGSDETDDGTRDDATGGEGADDDDETDDESDAEVGR